MIGQEVGRPLVQATPRYDEQNERAFRRELGLQLRDIFTRLMPYRTASEPWNPGSTANDAVATTLVSVRGAKVGQPVSVGYSSITTENVLLTAQVQAADTVRVVLLNKTGGALDPAAGTVTVVLWRV